MKISFISRTQKILPWQGTDLGRQSVVEKQRADRLLQMGLRDQATEDPSLLPRACICHF